MDWEFDLVGSMDAEDPGVRGNTDMILINVAYFDEARATGKGNTGWYTLRIDDPTHARGVAARIDKQFANSPYETRTQPEKEFMLGFAKQIGDIGAIVTRISLAVFFAILILTGNTMAQSIRERIPELAVLKTLGFSDNKVTALVLAEALALVLAGWAIGIGTAVALIPALNSSTGGRFPPLFIGPSTWILGASIATGVALAIGVPPALRARRLKIVDALSGHL
jgi:putative ABC transport system permease protein